MDMGVCVVSQGLGSESRLTSPQEEGRGRSRVDNEESETKGRTTDAESDRKVRPTLSLIEGDDRR
jgi:hypothetical protein